MVRRFGARAIAAAYRFTNPGRFARLFKEVFGQSPSEFRQAKIEPLADREGRLARPRRS